MLPHAHTVVGAGQFDLLAFAALGALGSAGHCVGMCSPFVMMVSRRYGRPSGAHAPWVAQAWYTAGRLLTYGVLGALAGGLGFALQSAGAVLGLQRAAAVIAGLALVLSGATGLLSFAAGGTLDRRMGQVVSRIGTRMPGHPLLLGLLLGLLPCGLLYTAVMAALALGSAAKGFGALVLFGLGTAPALFGVSLADAFFIRQRASLNRLSYVFVLAMGAWFLWRAALPSVL
jgi:sulfite exporter TauE/SafE